MQTYWQSLSLVERIKRIRYFLPLVLIPVVVVYQLQIAFRLEEAYGHPLHYAAEISFYSLVGPVVTWVTLIWVERRLAEKEALERQVHARTQQLASLTAASSDAILSLDPDGRIASWNQGATNLFGYPAGEMAGRSISEILPEAASRILQPGTRKSAKQIETAAVGQSGQRLKVDLTHTQLEQEKGSEAVSLLIIRDITVRAERAAILEEERGRISRDLHDGVAQTLYFLALKADMTRTQIGAAPEEAVVSLKEIGAQARKAIRDVRRAIFGLRPIEWAPGKFGRALKEFSEAFAEEIGFQIEARIPEKTTVIPPRMETVLFRLVQESLNNIAKHAEAAHVRLNLDIDKPRGKIILTVQDDGRGFEGGKVSTGLGLQQMDKRVTSIGGSFEITGGHDIGTLITAALPLPNRGVQNG